MKIKFKKHTNKYIDWDDLESGDVFEYNTRDDEEYTSLYIGIKVCGVDYGEFIYDIEDKEMYKYDTHDYHIIRKLNCTLVEDYDED